jgi:hypothetical protein
VLLYGSETWTIKARDASRITESEMKYTRTAGYSWTNYLTNLQIAKELKIFLISKFRRVLNLLTEGSETSTKPNLMPGENQKENTQELKVTPILDKLLEYKRNWIQHVNRMPRNRLPRIMKHYSPTGRRNHGRPLQRLLDT